MSPLEPRGDDQGDLCESTEDGRTLPAGELGGGNPTCQEVWFAARLGRRLMGARVQRLYGEKPTLASLISEGISLRLISMGSSPRASWFIGAVCTYLCLCF